MLVLIAVDHGVKPGLGQTKGYEIGFMNFTITSAEVS
jgi:hypothetical protein